MPERQRRRSGSAEDGVRGFRSARVVGAVRRAAPGIGATSGVYIRRRARLKESSRSSTFARAATGSPSSVADGGYAVAGGASCPSHRGCSARRRTSAVRQCVELRLGVREQPKHSASVTDDNATGGRDEDRSRAAATDDERGTDGDLEVRDLVADRRAGVPQSPRCADEAALLGDGDEGKERADLEAEPARCLERAAALVRARSRGPACVPSAPARGRPGRPSRDAGCHRARRPPPRTREDA